VPLELLGLLGSKTVQLGAIDVATDRVETPDEVAATIRRAFPYVAPERIEPTTNCGLAPLDRTLALAKLEALAAGTALVRRELGAK
jgi:5-methyltetrahydropteroyltriglutamate--homocysteine methyltransferase